LIANLIGAAGIPAKYPLPEFVDEGGLIAYSFDLIELNRRVVVISDGKGKSFGPAEFDDLLSFPTR